MSEHLFGHLKQKVVKNNKELVVYYGHENWRQNVNSKYNQDV